MTIDGEVELRICVLCTIQNFKKRSSLIYSRFFTVYGQTFIKIKKNNGHYGWEPNHHQLCLGIFL